MRQSWKSNPHISLILLQSLSLNLMKKQFLQSREVLIEHLQLKIKDLKEERKKLQGVETTFPNNKNTQLVNIQKYLQDQKQFVSGKDGKQKKDAPYEKARVLKEKQQTKLKLDQLKQLYEQKKQLQSIGIYENNVEKISSLYGNNKTKNQIDRKIIKQKQKAKLKEQKDKIIKQELQKVSQFLKEGKKSKRKLNSPIPPNHYSKIIDNQRDLNIYHQIIRKAVVSISEKQRVLDLTFDYLKNRAKDTIQKEKLKLFLLQNQQFCQKFYISKAQIMRDLQVHPTKTTNQFAYHQYYQLIKSIQITNKALYPNMNFKQAKKTSHLQSTQKRDAEEGDKIKAKKQKQLLEYLKKVYQYFDSKGQKIIERQKYEISLQKCFLFDEKKYELVVKKEIVQFGDILKKKKGTISTLNYYKQLDMKYIGWEQIVEEFKKYQKGEILVQETFQQSQKDIEQTEQITWQSNHEQKLLPQEFQYEHEELQKNTLQENDFAKYGWSEDASRQQQYAKLSDLDKYYKQIKNKYGNEIAWNGLQRYHEDFTKFNECIKQMDKQHKQ